MSDGEGFENVDDVVSEAQRAASAGTSVITVGFGSTAGVAGEGFPRALRRVASAPGRSVMPGLFRITNPYS